MKLKSFIIFLLIGITILSFFSCSKGKPEDSKKPSASNEVKSQEPNQAPHGEVPNISQLAHTLTPEILEEAHKLILAYPDAKWDNTKGMYSKAPLGDIYNIVYTTKDDIYKVAEFYRTNIAPEYLKEVKSSESDPKKWVHFTFGGEGFKHRGNIMLRELDDGSTEIIYFIENPKTPPQQKEESKKGS